MNLEKAMVRSGNARTIEEARNKIEKTREESGSDEDFYEELGKRFGITRFKQRVKSTVKPKVIRKRRKIVAQLVITFVGLWIMLNLFWNDEWELGWILLVLIVGTCLYLEKVVENIDRNETFK